MTVTASQLGLSFPGGYLVSEVFDGDDLGSVDLEEEVTVEVNPNGVQLLRFDVNPSRLWKMRLKQKHLTENDVNFLLHQEGDKEEEEQDAGVVVEEMGKTGGTRKRLEL